jgi:hypothetical protein
MTPFLFNFTVSIVSAVVRFGIKREPVSVHTVAVPGKQRHPQTIASILKWIYDKYSIINVIYYKEIVGVNVCQSKP